MNKNDFENTIRFTQKPSAYKNQHFALLRGDVGTAIIYYLLSRAFNKKSFERHGRKLLDRVSENSESIHTLNFGEGFTGIGWAIEWLIQNGFIKDMNSDDILVSIDQESYRSISFSKQEDCSLFTGLIGNIQYFEKRLLSKNPDAHRYGQLSNLEAFVFLTDDLESILINEDQTFNESVITESRLSIANLSIILTTCASAMQLNMNKSALETILNEGIKFSDKILTQAIQRIDEVHKRDKEELFNCLYLSVMYLIASETYNHKLWISSARQYIDILAERVLNTHVTKKDLLFKKMSVLCILHTHQSKLVYKKAILKCIHKLSSKDLPEDFYFGRGKLVLAELCLNKPEIIQNWHELFLIQ